MKLMDIMYFRTIFLGKEHLPASGSFIFASNHISNIDPFILGTSIRKKFCYVAKDSLFKTRLSSFFFAHVGAIPIKRDTSDFKAIREILKRLKNGCPVVLFPEGTRGVGDRKKKTQAGVGLIAFKSNAPVIPVYIQGSDKALPSGAKWFSRHQVKVKIGPPLQFLEKQPYHVISAKIMEEIYSLS